MSAAGEIYHSQLTARGGRTPQTARGSNHFLNKQSTRNSNFPNLKSSYSSTSLQRNHDIGSRPKLSSSRLSKKQSIADIRMLRQPQHSYQTHSKSLPHLSCDSGRPTPSPNHRSSARTNSNSQTARHRQSIKLNRKIVASVAKKRRGVGTRLLAPVAPTEEEVREERARLVAFQEKLREKLFEVDTELIAEETQLNKVQSMMAQFQSLTKDLDRMEENGIQQDAAAETAEQDARVEALRRESAVQTSAVDDPDIQRVLKEVNDEMTLMKTNSATFENVQGCSLGESYAPDVMQRNSDMYNGQQEIGAGPHQEFTAPTNLRATVIGGRYYPAGKEPESRKGDDGLFWPFEENRTKKSPPKPAARRVAPRAAHVSAKVQGGFGQILIDVNKPTKKHQQPSRWLKLDPAEDIQSMERAGVVASTPRMEAEWHPTVGGKCNARYSLDKEWYLCTILKISNKGLLVKFQSRGNNHVCTVQASNVKPVVWNRPLTSQWSR
jgi:hypothetical protein